MDMFIGGFIKTLARISSMRSVMENLPVDIRNGHFLNPEVAEVEKTFINMRKYLKQLYTTGKMDGHSYINLSKVLSEMKPILLNKK